MLYVMLKSFIYLLGGYKKLYNICRSDKVHFRSFFRLIWRAYHFFNSSSISYATNFKDIPAFPHLNGIFITGAATIGENCLIYQQVTIGSNLNKKSSRKGSPIIGDNCIIGAGSIIIGGITIGNNCVIGANTFVYKDIPDDSLIFAPMGEIIDNNKNNNEIYKIFSK
jgi:serine O-acetyltransferase